MLRVGKDEHVIQRRLGGSDTAWIFAPDYVYDLLRQGKFPLLCDNTVLDNVDGNVVIDKADDIQIQIIDRAFHFDDIFFSQLVAAGILDDCDGSV